MEDENEYERVPTMVVMLEGKEIHIGIPRGVSVVAPRPSGATFVEDNSDE